MSYDDEIYPNPHEDDEQCTWQIILLIIIIIGCFVTILTM